jgi:DNA-binding NarL/FixJ family response regulator
MKPVTYGAGFILCTISLKARLPVSPLTPMQLSILQLIVNGKYLKQAALELGMSEGDIRVNLFRARQRAGVDTLYQLVAVSVFWGWCSLPDRVADQPAAVSIETG